MATTHLIKIELPVPKKVKALGNKDVTITAIEIYEIRDRNVEKKVTAMCRNHPTQLVLWQGDAYDAIGQWTNDDVVARVAQLAAEFQDA
jgi:hypothetical protein